MTPAERTAIFGGWTLIALEHDHAAILLHSVDPIVRRRDYDGQDTTWTNRGGSVRTGRVDVGLLPRGAAMETFVGLDVSLKETSVCILSQKGHSFSRAKLNHSPL